ncbi:choice-of-anchor M domain-containing protein [Corynebacterium gerontici]|uniref:Uncharacterized protein n=1 Tax=Corynebacterium gerontici TaxID=2079234 RepID=A0A3G6IXW3_9CORY|nr:choice-of-anchor M domain-containing protein [Corynebacterium gerontici]AZA10611.1 hypothetical protein CGERO_01385 [Corynebacterium gerontici]
MRTILRVLLVLLACTLAIRPAYAVTLGEGHADFGPTLEGSFALQLRDDTVTPPQWRNAEDVVFALGQASEQQLPEDKDFAFTGAKAGDTVWVIPQTQKAGVPWLGWNTQAPNIQEAVDRGVTFEYVGHQGPGDFSLFLQDGGLGGPEKLFVEPGDTAWVDLGTHTHANWVFTQPGTHLVRIKVSAGNHQATADLRFAVGDTSEAAIKAAESSTWEGRSESSRSYIWLIAGGVLIVAALLFLRKKV